MNKKWTNIRSLLEYPSEENFYKILMSLNDDIEEYYEDSVRYCLQCMDDSWPVEFRSFSMSSFDVRAGKETIFSNDITLMPHAILIKSIFSGFDGREAGVVIDSYLRSEFSNSTTFLSVSDIGAHCCCQFENIHKDTVIEELHVDGSSFVGTEFFNGIKFKELKELSMDNCGISDNNMLEILTEFDLSGLISLSINNNWISTAMAEMIAGEIEEKMPCLWSLSAGHNSIALTEKLANMFPKQIKALIL